MLFSSIPFLYYFLPLTLLCYFLAPRRAKNAVLLFFSLIFYAWGEPKYVLFMVASILQGYLFGRLVEKYRTKNPRRSKLFLTASVLFSAALVWCNMEYWNAVYRLTGKKLAAWALWGVCIAASTGVAYFAGYIQGTLVPLAI